MSSRSNLIALLAVVAAAGYQNRDKIAEALKGLQGQRRATDDGASAQPQEQRVSGAS